MGKVMILEYTRILSIKIKNILIQIGFNNVEIADIHSVKENDITYMFKDTDLIFVDLDNGGIDFEGLIRSLKTKKETSDIPIISFSARSDVSTIKKAISLGCFDFILKPFDAETLIRKVSKATAKNVPIKAVQLFAENSELLGEGKIVLYWTKDFEIGIKEIDEEHRSIIEQYGKLYSMMKEGNGPEYYQELLIFLNQYVSTHFEHEERLQQEVGYDKFEEHKKLHDTFKRRISEIIESKNDRTEINTDLILINLFIKDWWIHHILITDQKIKMFINET